GEVMRTGIRVASVVVVSILLGAPSAHAQGYIAPSLGVVFGNPSAQGRADFIVDLGWLSRFEPLGFELDAMYAPSFFGNQGPYGENGVTTVMANIIVAGGGSDGRYGFGRRRNLLRPYASGGVGVMHEVVTTTVAAN